MGRSKFKVPSYVMYPYKALQWSRCHLHALKKSPIINYTDLQKIVFLKLKRQST